MLKKTERLNRPSFSLYFSKGKRIHGTYTTIIASPAEAFLCSVVVGKKVSKQAVVRNSIRRRLYGMVERYKTEKALTGVYIIIAKPAISKLSKKAFNVELEKEVGMALK